MVAVSGAARGSLAQRLSRDSAPPRCARRRKSPELCVMNWRSQEPQNRLVKLSPSTAPANSQVAARNRWSPHTEMASLVCAITWCIRNISRSSSSVSTALTRWTSGPLADHFCEGGKQLPPPLQAIARSPSKCQRVQGHSALQVDSVLLVAIKPT
jgi:hypothetical protein